MFKVYNELSLVLNFNYIYSMQYVTHFILIIVDIRVSI